MEAKGKFIGILSDDKGTTKENKDFRRVTFSIEIGDRYPKPAIFDTNNEDLIKTLSNLRSDEVISVAFNINCREYNGKWYTNLTAWKITI